MNGEINESTEAVFCGCCIQIKRFVSFVLSLNICVEKSLRQKNSTVVEPKTTVTGACYPKTQYLLSKDCTKVGGNHHHLSGASDSTPHLGHYSEFIAFD